MGYRNAEALFRNSGLVDELILCPSENDAPHKERKKLIRSSLKNINMDVILIPYYHNAPVKPLFFPAKAPVITFDSDVGFPRRLWYDLAHKRVEKDYSIHEVRNLYRLVSQLGVRFRPEPWRLSIPADVQKRIDDLISRLPIGSDPLILLHPGAGQSWKAWPLDNWDILARMIYKKFGIMPAFAGDESVGSRIENLVTMREGQAFNLCWAGDINGLAALILRGDILITNDSGPKHLAMSIGTPTITLYGTMDENRWGALWDKERHVSLRAVPADLSPEELLGLPPDYSMACIAPEMVMEVLMKYLSNIRTC
jgi:ADP-heptose:LPS heptosyltransferase